MPAKRASVERRLEDALDALIEALTETGAPWMIIGGIAVIARGVRRFLPTIERLTVALPPPDGTSGHAAARRMR